MEVRIIWMSSDINFIATNGEVTRPDSASGDQTVTLTATLSKGDATATKTFTLTVIALPSVGPTGDADAVSNASNALEITYTDGENSNAVSNNVILPTTNTSHEVRITLDVIGY